MPSSRTSRSLDRKIKTERTCNRQFSNTAAFNSNIEDLLSRYNSEEIQIFPECPIFACFVKRHRSALSTTSIIRKFRRYLETDQPGNAMDVKVISNMEYWRETCEDERGVFAARDIPVGTFLGEYRGDGITTDEFCERYQNCDTTHLRALQFTFGGPPGCDIVIDPYAKNESNLRDLSNKCIYINDSRLDMTRETLTSVDRRRQNAHYLWMQNGDKFNLYVIAVRRISKGSEILADYGESYSSLIEEIASWGTKINPITVKEDEGEEEDEEMKSESNHQPIPNSATKRFECWYCDMSTISNFDLVRHLRVHNGEKPFKCSECDYATAQKSNLTKHLRIHSGERPYQCPTCSQSFSDRSVLRDHQIKSHSKSQPFSCKTCGASFLRKFHLDDHKNIHVGRYKCRLCRRGYGTKKSYQVHMLREHQTEKNFECTECGKKFAWASQLKLHARSHAAVKEFPCRICQKGFAQKCSVKRHLQNVHNADL